MAQSQNYCPGLIANGSFEGGTIDSVPSQWFSSNSAQPAISKTTVSSDGERSLLLGLVDQQNSEGASIAWQTFRVPHSEAGVILSFRYYPLYDTDSGIRDLQYVELFNDFNSQLISRLVETQSNERSWRFKQFDLTPYAGQQITIYFGVQNDGVAGRTAMYVDDVRLECKGPVSDDDAPQAAEDTRSGAAATPVATSDQVAPANQVPVFSTSTPTPTPTITSSPTSSATPTPTTTAINTAVNTPVQCSPSEAGPLSVTYALTNANQSAIINVSANNAKSVTVTGPDNFIESRVGGGPYTISVPLQLGVTNRFNVAVEATQTNSICQVETVNLSTYVDIPGPIAAATATNTSVTPVTATNTPIPPTIEPSTCGNIPMAPRPASCQSIVVNGSFETNDKWHFGLDPVEAVFTNEQVSVGGRAVLLGNPPNRGVDNIKTYSSIRQPVTIPANVEQLQLRWRRFDVSEEGASANPDNTADRQDVIILSAYPHLEPIEIVSRRRCSSNQWQEFAINLDAERYAHDRNVVVYFNVYNDGLGGRSWSYLDNVELLVCSSGGNANAGSGNGGSTQVNPAAFSPTSTSTPNAVARATFTPYTVVLPTATQVPTLTPIPAPANSVGTDSGAGGSSATAEGNGSAERSGTVEQVVVTVVVTATPIGASGDAGGDADGSVEVSVVTDDTAANLGIPSVDTLEPRNQFLTGSRWISWLTSCGVLLGILGVIVYFAWGILRTLADGPEPYEDLE